MCDMFCLISIPQAEEISDGKDTSDTAAGTGSGTTSGPAPSDNIAPNQNEAHAAHHHDEGMSTTSNVDSEESMEDDIELDLDMTMDDKSDQTPLFIIFTCTIKSRLQQYSIPLKNLTVCLGRIMWITVYVNVHQTVGHVRSFSALTDTILGFVCNNDRRKFRERKLYNFTKTRCLKVQMTV